MDCQKAPFAQQVYRCYHLQSLQQTLGNIMSKGTFSHNCGPMNFQMGKNGVSLQLALRCFVLMRGSWGGCEFELMIFLKF